MNAKKIMMIAAALLAALALMVCDNGNSGGGVEPPPVPDGLGTLDPDFATDPYNVEYRIFPNAPEKGILSYEYFADNAPPTYWNNKQHIHKYPDLFHFANGRAVKNIKDWENRQKEIFNILQYYMHGKMPSLNELLIDAVDNGNTTTITLTHMPTAKVQTITVTHTPPAGAVAGAQTAPILFGVGDQAMGRSAEWGRAMFNTQWAGSESNRSGLCSQLYGFSPTAPDSPSINMQYAWAMSVVLTVIKDGKLGGYYDPDKVGIYGFSRYGKAAMSIGAFAKGMDGNQIGFTFVGSAGCGGPAIDRWINQMGYKNHTEDPLPVDWESVPNGGVNAFSDLKGIEWFTVKPIGDSHNPTLANGDPVDANVVRGWTAATLGIPEGSLIYNEYTAGGQNFIRNPGPPNSWGRIQVLSQARSEVNGWFSARFTQMQVRHGNATLDQGSGGVVCTMPFDSHYLAALIAPRIIMYEDGYNTMRNNPEGQWANWLMNDEVYQMYAEELNDPSIIWRNAIKMYDIEHNHNSYQSLDEAELVNAIYAGTQPDAKFRTPPFPADDPRYRWDFDRIDWGRPGHPTIAERVKKMRESPVPVKAVDTRGLLDNPEPLN